MAKLNPSTYTVDEAELVSVYRKLREKRYKGSLTLHFGGDSLEPGINLDLNNIKGSEVIEMFCDKNIIIRNREPYAKDN